MAKEQAPRKAVGRPKKAPPPDDIPRPEIMAGKAVSAPVEQYGSIADAWKSGRPYRYTDLGEIQQIIDGYFADCLVTEKKPTVMGLCLALGVGRKALWEWEHAQPSEEDGEAIGAFKVGLRNIVTRAKLSIAESWVPNLEDRDKTRGAEFMLKTMGYYDKPADNTISGPVTVNQNTLVIGGSVELDGLLSGLLPSALDKPRESQ